MYLNVSINTLFFKYSLKKHRLLFAVLFEAMFPKSLLLAILSKFNLYDSIIASYIKS